MPKSEMSSKVQQEEEQPEEQEHEEKKKKKKKKKTKGKKSKKSNKDQEEQQEEEEPKKEEEVEEEGNEEQAELKKLKNKKKKSKKPKSQVEEAPEPSKKSGISSVVKGQSQVGKGASTGASTKSKAPASAISGANKDAQKKKSRASKGGKPGRSYGHAKASGKEIKSGHKKSRASSENGKKGSKRSMTEVDGKPVDASVYETKDVNLLQVHLLLNPLKNMEGKEIGKKESGLDINRSEPRLKHKGTALQTDELAPRLKQKPSSHLLKKDRKDCSLAHTRDIPSAPPMDYPAFLQSHYNKAGPGPKNTNYSLDMFYRVMADASEVLRDEPALVDVEPPVTIVGDIHGQFNDLIAMFSILGPPPGRKYVFLGDFVDRGKMSCEVIMLLLAYKAFYPKSIVLLRGNHECARINSRYGFLKELESKFKDNHTHIWALFQKVFDLLPVSALIGARILCMHGGISPSLTDFDDLRNLPKPIRNPSRGVVNDLLWADPERNITGWKKSYRGSGFLFGAEALQEFTDRMGIDVVVRAHQVCLDGYYITRDFRLVTLFSAPMYCGLLRNCGAVLNVSEDLFLNFSVFVPESKGVFRRITEGNRVWGDDVDHIKDAE